VTEIDVLDEVVRMIEEVVGEDVLLGMEVTPQTTFSDDLGLESIEFVALAERLRERYGDRVDLVAFLGDMDIDEIMASSITSRRSLPRAPADPWPRSTPATCGSTSSGWVKTTPAPLWCSCTAS
jgi:acyl carrier protein